MKQTASAQHQSGHSSSSSKQSAKGSKERPAQKANKINTCGSVEQSKNRTADAKKELMHLIDYFPNAAQRMTRSRKNESRRQRARIASSSSESPDGRVIATKSAGTKLVKARQMAVKTLAPFAIESINGHLPTVAQVQEALVFQRISEERVDMEQIQLNNLIEQVEGQRENLVEQQNEQQQQQDEQQQNAQQQQQENEQQQNAQHQQQNEQQQNAQQQQHQQNAQQQQQNEQQQNAQQQQQQQNEQQQNALQQNAQQQQQQQNEQQQNAPQGEQQQQRKKKRKFPNLLSLNTNNTEYFGLILLVLIFLLQFVNLVSVFVLTRRKRDAEPILVGYKPNVLKVRDPFLQNDAAKNGGQEDGFCDDEMY
uniref:Uncharacterized protein n=1 Tax=Globodera rostochiensis TaxID=31243 RepID=A0A914IHK4_GLORO